MTFIPGQDGRLNFADLNDDQLKARRAALVKEANDKVTEVKSAGRNLTAADRDKLRAKVNHVNNIDAELQGRKSRRSGVGQYSDARSLDVDAGVIGGRMGGIGGGAKSFLTSTAIKATADGMAAKIAQAREGKSLSAAGGVGVDIVDPGLAPMGRPATVLDIVPVIGSSSPQIRYMKQTSRTNAAAVVAAGAVKPTSQYGLTPVDRTRKVVAHLSEPVAEYDLIDVPALTEFLNAELNFGLVRALEREIFYGDGTAAHLHGIAQEVGVQVQAFDTNIFATTRRAVTKVVNLGYNPQVFVLGPADLEAIDLATTSGSGEFVNQSGPFNPAEAKLWGVPVVVSTSLDAGEGFLLSEDSVKLYADQGPTIRTEWDRASDDFTRNQVRARLEGRFEVGVSRPEGIVRIDTAA